MLSNAYFLAKFRFDTAENEPAKNLQNFRKMHFRKMHCCAAVQPSHAVAIFLRKSARMVSSSFFSEKKKLKASKRLQRTLLGPQPRLQAIAVLSKTAKCLARERTRSRAQRDKDLICAGYAAAPSWKELYVSSRNEKPTTPTLAAHRDSHREVARCRFKTSKGMLCRTKEATALSMYTRAALTLFQRPSTHNFSKDLKCK